ncbi:hypothetical protein ACFPRL_35840 [Pseudoclavibacter helvolus]
MASRPSIVRRLLAVRSARDHHRPSPGTRLPGLLHRTDQDLWSLRRTWPRRLAPRRTTSMRALLLRDAQTPTLSRVRAQSVPHRVHEWPEGLRRLRGHSDHDGLPWMRLDRGNPQTSPLRRVPPARRDPTAVRRRCGRDP